MKIKNILWIFSLLIACSSFAQKDKVFSWSEAQKEDPLAVTHISFKGTKLNVIPAELERYKNLQFLDLSKTKLKDLSFFEKLEFDSLKVLKIERNKMKQTPIALCRLVNLEELWAYDNQFTDLPTCIGNLKKLKIIDLSDNMIENLPDELTKLKHLERLYLNGMILDKYFQEKWSKKLPNTVIEFGQPCDCLSH